MTRKEKENNHMHDHTRKNHGRRIYFVSMHYVAASNVGVSLLNSIRTTENITFRTYLKQV